MAKFDYDSKKQVKVKKPKNDKFTYSSKNQIKVIKPQKQAKSPKTESLRGLAEQVLFEKTAKDLTVVNPETKNRIKVTTALGYPHKHPAYKLAAALLKKKNITLPANVHAVKPGEQIPLFDLRPYEDPEALKKIRGLEDEDADTHLLETQSDFLDTIDSGARDAIETYCGSGFQYCNAYLRGDSESALNGWYESGFADNEEDGASDSHFDDMVFFVDGMVYNMDKVFEQPGAVLQEDIVVYRGVRSNSGIIEEVLDGGEGTIIGDDGFMSTSVNRGVGSRFAGPDGAILKIRVKKGTRGIYPNASNLSGSDDEKELILPRNTALKVLKIEQEEFKNVYNDSKSMRHIIHAEIVLREDATK